MFKENRFLALMVLVCSIFFAGGCGGGGSNGVGPEPEPQPYEEYGAVEKCGRLWWWIGVNEEFVPHSKHAFFTKEGEALEGLAEARKEYYFVDKNAYRHFVPESRNELEFMQVPGTHIEWNGTIGAIIKNPLEWVVGNSDTSYVTVHYLRPRDARLGTVIPARATFAIWVHEGPMPQPPYAALGRVSYHRSSLLWWELKADKSGRALPETLVIDEDGQEVTEIQSGRKYVFALKEELENFFPLRREEFKELLPHRDWNKIVYADDDYGIKMPRPIHPWRVPEAAHLLVHYGKPVPVTPGTIVDGAFEAWVFF